MVDLRTALAAVLGLGLGLVLLAYPAAVFRAQTAGRVPPDRGGKYGEPGAVAYRWRLLVRGIGVGLVIAGGYFATDVIRSLGLV